MLVLRLCFNYLSVNSKEQSRRYFSRPIVNNKSKVELILVDEECRIKSICSNGAGDLSGASDSAEQISENQSMGMIMAMATNCRVYCCKELKAQCRLNCGGVEQKWVGERSVYL